MTLTPEEWLATKATEDTIVTPEQWLSSNYPELATLESARLGKETGTSFERTVDPRVPALSTIAGATIGATPLGRTGSMLGGIVKGGIGGALGGTGGELVRMYDKSPYTEAVAFAVEMAGGAAPNLLGEFFSRATPSVLGATFGYQKGKAAQTIAGRTESDEAARQAAFGRQVMKEGVATTLVQDKTKEILSRDLANRFGVSVAANQKASDAVRNTIYDTIALEGAAKRPLKDSPEFIELFASLQEGVKAGTVKPADVKTIKSLLQGQVSSDPKIQQRFSERVINTIQQATPEWNGVKISDDAANVTRDALDKYLTRLGTERQGNNLLPIPTYNNLKGLEQQEIVAKAVDSIPVVLSDRFRGEAAQAALRNIHKSPEGQKQFKVALSTYFRELDPSKVVKEWNRLEGDLKKFKTIPFEDIMSIKRAVSEFSKRAEGKTIAKDIGTTALRNAIIRGLIPSELANIDVKEAQNIQYTLPSP